MDKESEFLVVRQSQRGELIIKTWNEYDMEKTTEPP